MKKLFSYVLVLCALISMLSTTVNAANYPVQYLTPGVPFDFETGFFDGDPKFELEKNTPTGNALKMNPGALLSIYFGDAADRFKNAMVNGDYLISFDALMSHVNGSYMLRAYAWTRNTVNPDTWPAQEVFFTLAGGKTTFSIKQVSLGDGGFEADEWVHYDFLCHFYDDETPTMDTFIDYEYQSTVPLDVGPEKKPINGLAAILIQAQLGSDGYAMLDNFVVKKFDEDISYNITLSDKNEFNINVSESVPALSKEDVTVTRIPLNGGSTEIIDYEFINNAGTNIVIKPLVVDGGYKYMFKINKTTTFGKEIPELEYSLGKAKNINTYWDFENGKPYTGTKQDHESVFVENRGYALDLSSTTDIVPFKIDSTLESGRYIVSYDVKPDAGEMKVAQIRNLVGNAFGNYQIFNVTEGLKSNDNLNTQKFIGGNTQILNSDQWYRIDNVYDLDAKKANVYIDGSFLGSVDLYGKLASKNTPITEFNGIHIQWANGAGMVDNVRVKTLNSLYNASVKADGDKLYVDFEETTLNLTDSNFKVTKADGFFDEGEEQAFELIYQNGTRAVLQLTEVAEAGKYYSVNLSDIKSFLGSDIQNTTVKTAVQGGDVSYIDNIVFTDVYGNEYSFGDVPSTLKSVKVSLPSGTDGAELDGTVKINSGDEAISGNLSYDEDNKILEFIFDKLIGSNGSFDVEVSGINDENGKPYVALNGIIKSGKTVRDITELSLTISGNEAEVTLFDVNTDYDYEAYVIVTGYKEGKLIYADLELLSSNVNSTENEKSFAFTSDKLQECDSVMTYVWNDWRNILPVVQSVSN